MSQFELHFELEPDCALSCKHCSSLAIKGETRRYDWNRVMRLINAVSPCEVYFTGGEPLLFPHLKQLLLRISMQFPKCKIGLFTTGIIRKEDRFEPVTMEDFSQLFQSGLRICYVSLYSNEEFWHDYMTDAPGSFRATVQAIQNMHTVGIDVRINLVITQFNIQSIRDIINYVSELKVSEVRLLKLIKHGNAINYWDVIGISDQDYLNAITLIHMHRKELAAKITFSGSPMLAPCRPIKHSLGCQARKNLLYVDLEGDIYPCACVKNNASYSICNLGDEYIEELICVSLDNKPYFKNCLVERNGCSMTLSDYLDDLFSRHFSNFSLISNAADIDDKISAFINEFESYISNFSFFELYREADQSKCLYYEVHSFFVDESVNTRELICYCSPDIDLSKVNNICRTKFPDSIIKYQVVDTPFVDYYIREELLKRFVNTFDSIAYHPENYLFVKEHIGL